MDDNLKKRGFTFLEVILVMIIISFSSLFLNIMMGVSLKGQTKASYVANKSYKSASNMELAVQSAREYSSYYDKMKNSPSSLAKKPDGYVDPMLVEIPGGLKIGNETISLINGYYAIADDKYDKHYKLNPGNASGFDSTYLYSYISQGYVTPNTSTFKEQYIIDGGSRKFVYMYDDTSRPHNEISGYYKLNDEDKDLFKTARIRWYRTKALTPLFTDDSGDKLGGSDSIQLGKIQDIKDKEKATFRLSAPFSRVNDPKYLEFTDNEIYFTIQTLNKNGHVGPIDMSRGKDTGQVSTLYYIGLPYLYGLINHMDSSIMLRQDTKGDVESGDPPTKMGIGTWYDILNSELKRTGILQGDEVEDDKVKWKDVRDYIDYVPRSSVENLPRLSDVDKMAFNFKEKKGIIEPSDFSKNIISYEKDTVLESKFPNLEYDDRMNSEVKGISLFMKFILNDSDEKGNYAPLDNPNSGVVSKPYNILSYNMKTSGELIDTGAGNAGFSLFTDNKNKLYLQISTINSEKGKDQLQNVIYCVSDDFDNLLSEKEVKTEHENGLYNSAYNPYSMIKDESEIYVRRKYVKILGITLGTYKSKREKKLENYIKIYMVANAGKEKHNGVEDLVLCKEYSINPTTKDGRNETVLEAFKAEKALKIGDSVTDCQGSSSSSVPALVLASPEVNPEVSFTDVLYYEYDLSQYPNAIATSSRTDDNRADRTVMYYLYRKSLSEDERRTYDEKFYYGRCIK